MKATCLILWLATLAFAFQGARGLWDPDEGRYALVALNMLDSGDYLVPRASDHPHYAKPPLTYWAMAASLHSFGITELAVRLPNAVAFVLTGIVVTWLGLMSSLRRPWIATAIWATSLLPFISANVATTDTMLTFFETLAVAGYVSLRWGVDVTHRHRSRWIMWVAFGCGFLTKGPPSLLPLLAIVIFERFVLRSRPSTSIYAPAPILVASLIGSSWFVFVAIQDPHLVRYFLLDEFVYRVATGMHDRNPGFVGLFKAYGATVVLGGLPWAPLVLWHALRERGRVPANPASARRPDVKARFVKYWAVTMLIVFSLSQSRLPLYLLPLAVPFALLGARALDRHSVSTRTILAVAVLGSTCLIGIKYYGSIMSSSRDSRELAREFLQQNQPVEAEELVFVGSAPSYGMGFYLRKHIDAVDRKSSARRASFERAESLCDELQDHDRAVLVVELGHEKDVERAARRCRAGDVRQVGALRHFALLQSPSRNG